MIVISLNNIVNAYHRNYNQLEKFIQGDPATKGKVSSSKIKEPLYKDKNQQKNDEQVLITNGNNDHKRKNNFPPPTNILSWFIGEKPHSLPKHTDQESQHHEQIYNRTCNNNRLSSRMKPEGDKNYQDSFLNKKKEDCLEDS